MLCAYSENRVRPELSIPATGQKDRGFWGRECRWRRINPTKPVVIPQRLVLSEVCFGLNFNISKLVYYYLCTLGKKSSGHQEEKSDEKLPSSIGSVLYSFREFCSIMWLLHARDKMSKSSRKYRQLRSQSTGSEEVYANCIFL